MESKYVKEYVVPSSCCDYAGELGLSGCAGQFMDIATDHADRLGIGFSEIGREHLFWIAIRTRVDIVKKPAIGQRIALETWTEPPTRITFDRDYVLRTDAGEKLVSGKTQWGLFNTVTGRLEMGKNVYPKELTPIAESATGEPFYRFTDEPANEPVGEYTVRSTDIDLGGHMNNVAYIRAFEAMFTVKQRKELDFRSVEVQYKKPCFEGDTLVFSKCEVEKGTVVRGTVNGEVSVWMLLRH